MHSGSGYDVPEYPDVVTLKVSLLLAGNTLMYTEERHPCISAAAIAISHRFHTRDTVSECMKKTDLRT